MDGLVEERVRRHLWRMGQGTVQLGVECAPDRAHPALADRADPAIPAGRQPPEIFRHPPTGPAVDRCFIGISSVIGSILRKSTDRHGSRIAPMAKYGIFEKAVKGFLRFPATKHAAEDVSPAEMLRDAVKAQKKIDEEVSRIEAAAPKAVDQTELLREQIRDAAESQTKIGMEAWRVDVNTAASKAAFDSGFQHTELEQVLDALTERTAPIPLHPVADAEIKKMLATPAGIREATNLYLDPVAMKEWQTRLLQKRIDENVLAAQEKIGMTIKVAAYGRRLDAIQQAAEELDLKAEKAYQKASLERVGGEIIPSRYDSYELAWRPGGSWQNSEHWLSDKERDDLARLGVEAGEIEHKLLHLPIDLSEEEEGFRLLADATDIANHDPGLALDASKLDEIRRLCPERSRTYQYKPENSTQVTQISEHALRPSIMFDIFGRVEVIQLPDGTLVERPVSTTAGWVSRWGKGASFPFWPSRMTLEQWRAP